jgi:hypothetical protein
LRTSACKEGGSLSGGTQCITPRVESAIIFIRDIPHVQGRALSKKWMEKRMTNVSEVLAAFIIRAIRAARTSETSVNFYRLHGTTSQKTVIFLLGCLVN